MKKEFIEKVMNAGTIDTREYRYVCKEDYNKNAYIIKRIPLSSLGTTESIDGWEEVVKAK